MDVQIVEDALRAFITKEIRRALGEEYLDVYSPPHNATSVELIRYISDKWLGIFADSHTVANKRQFFADALKALKKNPNDAALNERILAEIGNPGKAAALNNVTGGNRNGNRKNTVDANAYGGIPGTSPTLATTAPATNIRTVSKTSAYPNDRHRSASNFQHTHIHVDADGDMPMGGDEGRTNLSSNTITNSNSAHMHSSSSSSARQTFPSPLHNMNANGDGNVNININSDDSAMVDVELAGGTGNPDEIVVVLDGANIGWRYGATRFSMLGVMASVAHYQRLTCSVIVVLPDSLCASNTSNNNISQEEREAINWMNSLKGTSQLILTPDSDYDDAYVTHLARRLSAILVSNDLFKDQIYQATADGRKAENDWKIYLAKCRCSFAFLGKIFVPNPAFDMRRGAVFARKYSLSPD